MYVFLTSYEILLICLSSTSKQIILFNILLYWTLICVILLLVLDLLLFYFLYFFCIWQFIKEQSIWKKVLAYGCHEIVQIHLQNTSDEVFECHPSCWTEKKCQFTKFQLLCMNQSYCFIKEKINIFLWLLLNSWFRTRNTYVITYLFDCDIWRNFLK